MMIQRKPRESQIEEVCSGYIFVGCVIKDSETVYLLARKNLTIEEASSLNDHEISSSIIGILERDGDYPIVGGIDVDHFERPVLGHVLKPKSQLLIVANDIDGSVLPLGGGKQAWPFESLHKGALPGCKRLRCIDGYAWAAGNRRLVYKRTSMGKWINIRDGFDPGMSPFGELKNKNAGFQDIDGFSENEVYAVGGQGDVWKYNGKQWSQCGFPTNDDLYTLCCAKDGFVYIGARNALWKGKDNEWSQLCKFELPDEMNDLRWFDNKIWIAYDYSLSVWDGEKLSNKVVYKGEELPLCGYLDACEDMLVIASSNEVWSYDGNDWYNIIPKFH